MCYAPTWQAAAAKSGPLTPTMMGNGRRLGQLILLGWGGRLPSAATRQAAFQQHQRRQHRWPAAGTVHPHPPLCTGQGQRLQLLPCSSLSGQTGCNAPGGRQHQRSSSIGHRHQRPMAMDHCLHTLCASWRQHLHGVCPRASQECPLLCRLSSPRPSSFLLGLWTAEAACSTMGATGRLATSTLLRAWLLSQAAPTRITTICCG